MDENTPQTSKAFVDALSNMANKKGLSPDKFASLVFEAIERGDYWITPQPESLDDRFALRTKMILERHNPEGINRLQAQ